MTVERPLQALARVLLITAVSTIVSFQYVALLVMSSEPLVVVES